MGDVVTVEGTTGTVTKIQMRATTIINWDRQEFVVPNKTLITSTLLNWTLSAPLKAVWGRPSYELPVWRDVITNTTERILTGPVC